MPGIIVLRNGKELASVNSGDFNILTVNLHGDVSGEEFSNLEFTGGIYGQDDKDCHLIWINSLDVLPSDSLEIRFVQSSPNDSKGQTIDELFPGEKDQLKEDESLEEIFDSLVKLPKVRDCFNFAIEKPDGEVVRIRTSKTDWSYHCIAMWQSRKPEKLRVSLSSNELERIKNQENGAKHFEQAIFLGESIKIKFIT
ncbi:hypothetical protein NBRC116493_27690 [Aurantivibrio infirmus]